MAFYPPKYSFIHRRLSLNSQPHLCLSSPKGLQTKLTIEKIKSIVLKSIKQISSVKNTNSNLLNFQSKVHSRDLARFNLNNWYWPNNNTSPYTYPFTFSPIETIRYKAKNIIVFSSLEIYIKYPFFSDIFGSDILFLWIFFLLT